MHVKLTPALNTIALVRTAVSRIIKVLIVFLTAVNMVLASTAIASATPAGLEFHVKVSIVPATHLDLLVLSIVVGMDHAQIPARARAIWVGLVLIVLM
jgi:hypothetical protein